MKKMLLFSFLTFFLFQQNIFATPVAVVDIHPTPEKMEVQKKQKKKKRKRFLSRLTERILEKKMGRMVKKMGLYPVIDSTKCDVLIKSDGDEMNVRITEVGVETIKFKNCDDIEGPTLSLNKKAAFMIKYANGKKEVFKNIESVREDRMVVNRYPIEENSTGGFGTGFLLGGLLFLFGLLVVLIAFKGQKRKNAVRGALVGILAIFLLLLSAGY